MLLRDDLRAKHFAAAMLAGALTCTLLPSCGVKTTNEYAEMASELNGKRQEAPSLYKDRLNEVISQANEDFDRLDINSTQEMREYYAIVSESVHLISDTTATQDDIDQAVDRITNARARALDGGADPSDDECEALPSYDEFVANVDQYVGRKFAISGHITGKETSVLLEKDRAGKSIWAHVYWDESQTQGQVAAVRIPYERYSGISGTWLTGECVCEGLDDRGHPQFEAIEYEVGHGE